MNYQQQAQDLSDHDLAAELRKGIAATQSFQHRSWGKLRGVMLEAALRLEQGASESSRRGR